MTATPALGSEPAKLLGLAAVLGSGAGLAPTILAQFGPLALAPFVLLLAILAVFVYGPKVALLGVVVLVPLIPVTTAGLFAGVLGEQGALLRSGLIVGAIGLLVLLYGGRLPRPERPLRPLVLWLLALAAFGVVVSMATVTENQSLFDLLGHRAGQPLVYAGLLVFFAAQIRRGADAKRQLLIAFSVGLCAEAAIVAFELASGAAFDAVRGFTRAQGTVGANFVSAFAMMGLFIALAERRIGLESNDVRLRQIGTVSVLAALFLIVVVVSRGGVIGAVLGFGYLIVTDQRLRRRARIGAAVGAALLVASLATPAADLWTNRLSTDSVRQFDRPATWVSGVRIGLDNPLVGLGDEPEVFQAVNGRIDYKVTPFGSTAIVPHNSWILSLAEGGFVTLVIFLAVTWAAVLAVLRRPIRDAEARLYVAGLIGITGIAMINNVYSHPELALPALLLLALLSVPVRAGGSGAGERPLGVDRRL